MTGFINLFLCFIVVTTVTSLQFRCPSGGVFSHYDPNIFYLCADSNMDAVTSNCDFGRGFLQNDIVTGCIPFEEWKCTNKMGSMPPKCDTDNSLNKEYSHLNPNMYWKCPSVKNERAVLMLCESGKGFSEHSGCVNWTNWNCIDRNYE